MAPKASLTVSSEDVSRTLLSTCGSMTKERLIIRCQRENMMIYYDVEIDDFQNDDGVYSLFQEQG